MDESTEPDAGRFDAPLAVGGVGGSGTRVVAAALVALGWDMGRDLNEALDNLSFTLLFKAQDVPDLDGEAFAARAGLFARAMRGGEPLAATERGLLQRLCLHGRPGTPPFEHDPAWLAARADALAQRAQASPRPRGMPWGWKEPNTHVVLPQLRRVFPALRYLHVVRNGLDMAFSHNQNQLAFWGGRFLGRPVQRTPRDALAYWCAVHRRVRDLGAAMGGDFLWLDYDDLCADPMAGMQRLLGFLGRPASGAAALAAPVKPQASSGRHRAHPLDSLDPRDLDFLREIGHFDPV